MGCFEGSIPAALLPTDCRVEGAKAPRQLFPVTRTVVLGSTQLDVMASRAGLVGGLTWSDLASSSYPAETYAPERLPVNCRTGEGMGCVRVPRPLWLCNSQPQSSVTSHSSVVLWADGALLMWGLVQFQARSVGSGIIGRLLLTQVW